VVLAARKADRNHPMNGHKLSTPVALFLYRRPECTAESFRVVSAQQPPKLLIVADGPKSDQEREQCLAARRIVERIDWPCEVLRNYSDTNLGCRRRMWTGLDWVFSLVDRAILIEDDCVPHASFFRFAEEMLERYKDEPRVMMINAMSSPPFAGRNDQSYWFTRYPLVWGWATWRRAWRLYDAEMRAWPGKRQEGMLGRMLQDEDACEYWTGMLDRAHANQIDTWDYMWTFSCWANDGVSIIPSVNMVKNIGFGAEATHTTDSDSKHARLAAKEMIFPLRHPAGIEVSPADDKTLFAHSFGWKRPSRLERYWVAARWYRRRLRQLLRGGKMSSS